MSEHPSGESGRDRSGSAAARGAWMASGVTFFAVGVAFTFALPDNFALGITFLGLGVVFFSLAGTARAPGDGAGAEADGSDVHGSVAPGSDAPGSGSPSASPTASPSGPPTSEPPSEPTPESPRA